MHKTLRPASRAAAPAQRTGAARRLGAWAALGAGAALVSACALVPAALLPGQPQELPPAPSAALGKHTVQAVTQTHELITFKADQPHLVLRRVALRGLAAQEEILGIDYRVARGVLFALTSSGRLYTIDTASGQLSPVGAQPFAQALPAGRIGFDFNPVADRLRIVSDTGLSLRAHPETGALVDGDTQAPGWQPDGALRYAADDANAGKAPRVVAAGYTYNKRDAKLTTNYAIDLATGALVMQGSAEGALPVVSPNSGQLRTVGALAVAGASDASLDIADTDNTAFGALRTDRTRLYQIDLGSGRARLIGLIADGAALRGIAIEP